MDKSRQHFNEEFKRQTVKYIQEQVKSVPDIAEELNIPAKTLHAWLGKYRQFEDEPIANTDRVRELENQLKQQELELREKDRRLADLEEDLTIIKKAMHIFSNPRN
jgi:transposase